MDGLIVKLDCSDVLSRPAVVTIVGDRVTQTLRAEITIKFSR